MLDFADVVAINKFERRGAEDARRDVAPAARAQPRRVRHAVGGHAGLRHQRRAVRRRRRHRALPAPARRCSPSAACRASTALPTVDGRASTEAHRGPARRPRALPGRGRRDRPRLPRRTERQVAAARRACSSSATRELRVRRGRARRRRRRCALLGEAADRLDADARGLLDGWPELREAYRGDEQVYVVRGKEVHTQLTPRPCPGTHVPRVALPRDDDDGDAAAVPARRRTCPATSPSPPGCSRSSARVRIRRGCSPARATRRAPTAGSTCSAEGQPATRLSTAFDSVTLYGRDPTPAPDVYGKVGTSGVSVATLDDMRDLYAGFDLCSPTTSVSMTINGPAPTILAMYFNTAIDQQVDRFRAEEGREPDAAEPRRSRPHGLDRARHRPGRHPQGGPGPEHLHLLDRVLAAR